MAVELKDFRGKITEETDAWLESESRVHGRDRSDIVRVLLHTHALNKIREASVLTSLVQAQGLGREDEGTSGSEALSGRRSRP